MAGNQPHHDGSALYVGSSTPELGQRVALRLRVPQDWGTASRVWVRSVQDAEPRYDEATVVGNSGGWVWWETTILHVNPVALYRFVIETAGSEDDGPSYWYLNNAGLYNRDTSDYNDFRVTTAKAAPAWSHDAVMYQVFPDRFARSEKAAGLPTPDWGVACGWDTPVQGSGPDVARQFYGGDLDGVTEKLDELEALGADIVYLTPFFPGRSNHRYDASTFMEVDPLLGGDEALIRLVEAAHARGMKVMGDLTSNHTGDAHEWFKRAQADPNSVEASFYYFNEDRTEYESWWGVKSLPKLNWASAALREAFVTGEDSVVAHWLKPPFNLDGWRIDVGNMTGRLGAQNINKEVAALIQDRILEINPNALLLGEETSDAGADVDGFGWQGAMTYSNFTRPLWQWLADPAARVDFFGTPLAGPPKVGADVVLETHRDLSSAFSWPVRKATMNALNTHDTARAASVMIAGGPLVAAALSMLVPGIAVVFAGDEFGLKGWNGEDSRTPIPWDEPDRVVTDLRSAYAVLTELRHTSPAVSDGGMRWLMADGDVLAFVRESPEESLLVIATRSPALFPVTELGLSAADVQALMLVPAFATAEFGATEEKLQLDGPGAYVWRLAGVTVPEA
ncbi:glycoside hydrolase family 13 protein [Arthrobacter sp. N199823]|uniref:glycoside hydrolase family 13 protein n=1 Tax=Arthrobacter sp. N199823 TaxID=2058895 RepID=UPI000CE450E1|nr:glycoside hydrolase family 13 protein [Arthrobacter sp. N199823]